MTVQVGVPARAAWGLVLLGAPGAVEAALGRHGDRPARVVGRALGVRQVAQAALSGRAPSPQVVALGMWVDLAHASSMVLLAAVDHRRVRAALTDAAIATAWASWGYGRLRHAAADHRTPDRGHDRRRDRLAGVLLTRLPGGRALLGLADGSGGPR